MKKSMHVIEKAFGDMSIKTQRMYTGSGLSMREVRVVQTESDFNASTNERFSDDNGSTWTEYTPVGDYLERDGEKEIIRFTSAVVPNEVTGHVIRMVMERVFLYSHEKAYKTYWTTGVMDWRDHTYIEISRDNGKSYDRKYLLAYEDSNDLDYNHGYHGTNIEVAEDGTIYTSICAPLESVCRAYGLAASLYALSPVVTKAVIVFTLKANGTQYVQKRSEPIIISDAKSSRGLLEPNIMKLEDGSLMLECRGSNALAEGWKTRMEKGVPSHRWMSYSMDGVRFTEPIPMTYDTGEAFYSPSSISKWLRHSKSGKLYWLGNITPDIPEGNRPRYPLCVGEFDEKRRCLLKDTVIAIDDKLPGEGDLVQHSNFTFYEDRKTHAMHIEYSRLGQNPGFKWQGDAVRITLEEE